MLVQVVDNKTLENWMQDRGYSIGGLALKTGHHWLTIQAMLLASKSGKPYSPHAKVKWDVALALEVEVSDIFSIVEGGDDNDGVTNPNIKGVSTSVD